MINKVSNSQNNYHQSFKAATLKINKPYLLTNGIEVKLASWQQEDMLEELQKRINLARLKFTQEEKNVKTFIFNDGDILTLHSNNEGFAEKIKLITKNGDNEVTMTPEDISQNVRYDFQSVVNSLNKFKLV